MLNNIIRMFNPSYLSRREILDKIKGNLSNIKYGKYKNREAAAINQALEGIGLKA